METEKIVEEFVVFKTARNMRPKSHTAYRSSLMMFFTAVGKPPDKVVVEDIEQYVLQLKLDGKSINTQRFRQGVLRTFFAWLSKRYHIPNPAESLYPIREEIKIPIMPTPDEFIRMVYTCDTTKPIGRRNAALLVLAADTGMRLQEITELNVGNIQLHNSNFSVIVPRVKGGRERVVPFAKLTQGSLVAEHWTNYWQEIKFVHHWPDRHPLFVQQGPVQSGDRLGSKGIQVMVLNAAKRAGITKPLRPHALRHFFATYAYLNGTDLRTLQALMGHVWSETTNRYIHIAESIGGKTLDTRASSHMSAEDHAHGFVKILQDAIKQTKRMP